jgi:diguanylate cyclase (GGDEF)-like protein
MIMSAPIPANVMVVDDTPANLKLLDALLRRHGHQVRLFPCGALALKAAAARVPDLILLDVMMPEMDGYEVCRRLKAMPGLADVPVIFISALAETDSKVRAFAEGGVDYVTKPFQDAEVLARVGTHLALHAMRCAKARQQADLERLVRERTADLLRAQQVAHIGSWKLDLRNRALSWSPETYRLFGVPEDTPLTLDGFLAKVHPDDRDRVARAWAAALKDQTYEVEHRITPPAAATWVRERAEFDTGPDGLVHTAWGTVQDISEAKAYHAHVEFITHHDVLTGLPNRAKFLELLRVCMAACSTQQTRLAVAYIDMDGFAAVNAQLGRERGNRLIVEIGRRLARSLRDRQYLARIGGDEFAVILTQLGDADAFAVPVRRILQAVAEPLEIEGHRLQLTASIGVAGFPQAADGMEAEQVLRQSDQAMYLAKLTGKNRYHVFDPLKDESARERFIRIEEVRRGLNAGEMHLYYQPKVWLATGEVAGFEALIRWQHPQRGLVPPGQFIPLLEQHPLAVTLGDWVIETALAQLAAWNARGLCTRVGVNVDALQLADPDFAPRLASQLAAQPGVAPAQLDLEILETGALDDMAEEAALIARVQRMGVTCSLDDFGTGFSSLTFLKQIAAQTIKIDQSFVLGMLDDSEHASIVNSVLGLARSFDRYTLAEGVETEHHGRMLLELGCDLAQGYAIARPMPAAEVPAWLSRWQVPPSWLHITPLEPGDVPLLLAEVEHRAWMKAMRKYLAEAEAETEPRGAQACPFGVWLAQPATQRRYGRMAELGEVEVRHHALHREGAALLGTVQALRSRSTVTPANAVEPVAGHPEVLQGWSRLEAHSAALAQALEGLRRRRSDMSAGVWIARPFRGLGSAGKAAPA